MKAIRCYKCEGRGKRISGTVCKYLKKCKTCNGKGKRLIINKKDLVK
jgi:DnaJ-class molecular chaperone